MTRFRTRPDYGPLEPAPYLGTTVRVYARRPRSLDELLRCAAATWPRRTAVEAPSAVLSYAELDRAVDAMTAALAAQGAGAGDRIAVALGHDLPLFALPFACSRLGATALLLNTALSPVRWSDQLERAGCTLLVADDAHAPRLRSAAGGRPVRTAAEALRTDAAPTGLIPLPASRAEDHPLALIATSGTTGVPKMTAVTSRGLVHAALCYVDLLDLDGTDRTFVALPLHYIGPLSAQTTTMPLVGGCTVIPSATRAGGALGRMAAARITHLDAVPSWLSLLVRDTGGTVPAAWRTLIYGGAPMPPETAARLAARFPALRMFDLWGLSETHGPATALRYDPAAPPAPGTVGRPLPGVEVRSDGEPGELLVRGANVTPGYLDDPETTAAVLREGWLATGDVGTVGADGTVRILDRKKDVILRGGANVFSVEVEQVLASAGGVVEAAVYGVADGLGGEAVSAAVVLADGAALDTAALRRLVGERIGRDAVPRRIVALPSLPRNPTGKIDKRRLRQEHG